MLRLLPCVMWLGDREMPEIGPRIGCTKDLAHSAVGCDFCICRRCGKEHSARTGRSYGRTQAQGNCVVETRE